ncbi:hypothetical protein JTE90_017157 [Oedothorax gibbosus]|uniref:C2H2-type domain-containing protein n=1 Tax=Oedothorax gibbosus TaxID=931172 RepID=A0AAV6TKY6_9ARAC|nr:hypothetical protein JTE90_017157 [Oedothorax gibbosus]
MATYGNVLRCDLCEKCFTGPIPYAQHMGGQGHQKKVDQAVQTVELGVGYFRCGICTKCFTGPIPYEQHMAGQGHHAKVSLAQKMSEVKEKHPQNGEKIPLENCNKDLESKDPKGTIPLKRGPVDRTSDATTEPTSSSDLERAILDITGFQSVQDWDKFCQEICNTKEKPKN